MNDEKPTERYLRRMFKNAPESFFKANSHQVVDTINKPMPTIQELWDDYQKSGSVHKTCKLLGVSGETLRRLFNNNGFRLNNSKWDSNEISHLKELYASPNGVDLTIIALKFKRTHAAIACKADELGLTSNRGEHKVTELARANISKGQEERMSHPEARKIVREGAIRWHKNNPHPKGMLGKHHSDEVKNNISDKLKGRKIPRSRILRSMETRIKRYGSLCPNLKRGTWKAAWREIGGIKKFYRSRWEANYARYLEFQKQCNLIIKWEHECETFWFKGIKRGCVSYLPDFKITNTNGSIEYHEVKGWMDSKSITKIKRMKKYYPNVVLKIFDGKWYKANKRKLSSLIKDWE